MKKPLVIFMALGLAGCLNMPTPPSRITGSYTTGLIYQKFNCSRLTIELSNLTKRENTLVSVQKQRIDESEVQAFWWFVGKGDGMAAAELANVRGEQNAVRKVMRIKGC